MNNKKYLRPGKYNPGGGDVIYYEKGANCFIATTWPSNPNVLEIISGPSSGDADHYKIDIKLKKDLLAIIDEYGFNTRKLMKLVRANDVETLKEAEERKNDGKLHLNLVGKDGNAFSLLAYFRSQAKKAGWNKEKIDATIKEATSGDYGHLLYILGEV